MSNISVSEIIMLSIVIGIISLVLYHIKYIIFLVVPLISFIVLSIMAVSLFTESIQEDNKTLLAISIGIALFSYVMLKSFNHNNEQYKRKCPHCKEWGVLTKVNSEYLGKGIRNKKVVNREKVRDSKGHVIETYERESIIPTEVEYYNETYHCSNCKKSSLKKGYIEV